MKGLQKCLTKINKTHSAYESAIGNLEYEISKYVIFDFTIFWQPADGFVLEYNARNAPLDKCIQIIEEKGELTFDDFDYITI